VPFKIKDLMIDVTSIPKACIGGTLCAQPSLCGSCSHFVTACGHCSAVVSACGFQCSHLISFCAGCSFAITNPCTLHCTHIGSQCFTGSIACPGSIITTTPFQVELDPGVLKEQLKAALKIAEEREKEFNDSLAVKTLADAELLEGKLSEALEEVQRLKKTLK
jgi:hypothetical protein